MKLLLAAILLAMLAQAADPPVHLDVCRVDAANADFNFADLQQKLAKLQYELIVRDACEAAGIKRAQCTVDSKGFVVDHSPPPAPESDDE